MDLPATRAAELLRKSYSQDELFDIYELGKLWLESGQHRRAEAIMNGLNEVASDFAPAWLGTAFLRSISGNYEGVLNAAKQALRIAPESIEAMLYIVTAALALKDLSTAGTYLGEVGERIEQGGVSNPHVSRFFKMQLARYQNRG